MSAVLFSFEVAEAPMSWNTLARKHYWTFKQAFDRWKWLTSAAVSEISPPPFEGPVRVVFEAGWKGRRRHDIDNIVVKPILDELKARGFFPDDDAAHVAEVVLKGSTGCQEDGLKVSCERIG